jgi:hypothetical protein
VGRVGSVSRATKETRIYAWVNLDGTGESDIRTGCVFQDARRWPRGAIDSSSSKHLTLTNTSR